MGRRGPPAQPIERHRERGSSVRYTRKGEPDSLPGDPEMHPLVAGNPEAELEWAGMRERLTQLRVWSKQYEKPLATYCLLWSKFVANERELTLTFNERDKLLNQLMKFWREFGCTPASKTMLRVDEDQPQESDPDSKFGVVA